MPDGLRPWVSGLELKAQCQLFSAMRGPDGGTSCEVKKVVRWFRGLVVYSLEKGHYTKVEGRLPSFRAFGRGVEWLSLHYVLHLAEGLAVVASSYPAELDVVCGVRARARGYLRAMTRDLVTLVEGGEL